MTDIGGPGSLGNDPFAEAARRQQQGEGLVDPQRGAQERAAERAREAQPLETLGGRSPAERERDDIRDEAGPGIRRDALLRTGNAPIFRQTSDETADLDAAARQRSRDGQPAAPAGAAPRDEVNISREARERVAAADAAPPPGEAVLPAPDDPLRIDTAQEQQRVELSEPVDHGRNESPAGRALGQILDQFS